MTIAYLVRDFPKTELPVPLAFPKPSQIRRKHEAVIKLSSGREICSNTRAGQAEYRKRTVLMFERDNGICCICHKLIDSHEYPTFEHTDGRGMGGGRRDDRVRLNGVAHFRCNSESGSKREPVGQQLDDQPCLDCDSVVCLCGEYEGGAL